MLHHCNTLALGYPSPPSGWVWTLPAICAIFPVSPFSSRALPGTQQIAGDGLGKAVLLFERQYLTGSFYLYYNFSVIVTQPLSFPFY